MKTFKWSDISKYRDELFGLAIISIIFFHYFEHVPQAEYIHSSIFKLIARIYNGVIGSVGVDVFLFLSGLGIYYSLRKKPRLLDFYQKRITRVIVPYLILGSIFWCIRDLVILKKSFLTFLYDFTLLSFWVEGERAIWYISLICCLYLFSPFVYSAGKKSMIITSIISITLSIGIYFISLKVFYNIEIAILRIPIYFLGMLCATLAFDEKESHFKLFCWGALLALFLKGITGYFDFAFARLFNTPYAIALILTYICLRRLIKKGTIIKRFLTCTGRYSLELYITHVSVRGVMGILDMHLANPLVYGFCILISIFVTIGYAKMYKNILIMGK